MRKIIAIAFLALFSVASFAQERGLRNIKANGVFQEKKRRVQPYTKLVVEGDIIVEILNNPFKNTVQTQGDGNLHHLIQTSVENGVLTVKRRPGFVVQNQSEPLKIKLMTQDLTEITMTGDNGNVTNMGTIQVPEFKVTHTGNGKLTLRLRTENLTINTENDAALTIEGNANTVKIQHDSSGDINLKELSNFFTEVISNGSGDIYTNTVNGIDGSLNGSGNLYYILTKVVNLEENGSGKAIKNSN